MHTFWRAAAVIAIIGMSPVPSFAVIERIQPMYADAGYIVEQLWGSEGAAEQPDPVPSFAADLVRDAVQQMPRTGGRWVQGTMTRQLLPEQSNGPAVGDTGSIVPEGIEGRPLVIHSQNAMLVKGTPLAIDRLKEIIAMFDAPARMVNIDVRSIDAPEEEVSGWGVDWFFDRGDIEAGSRGNRPGGGLELRWGRGDFRAGVNIIDRSTRGKHVMGANVLTHNNSPALVVFGETLPFVTTETTYDQWGYRRGVAQTVNTVFLGMELWVAPRINGDETVTVRVRPSISEWAGEVSPPGPGTPIPITRTQLADTSVTVRDGESIVIGGMERSVDEINERFRGLFGKIRHRMASHPTLILTPTIVRHQQIRRGTDIP